MFHKYPYTDFHELNLDYLLNKMKEIGNDLVKVNESYKETIKLFDDIEAGVENIVDEYLSTAENIALRSDLTSNDIDIEEIFNFHFEDGRYSGTTNYCVFQSFLRMNDGNFVAISNDEREESDVGLIRIYSEDGLLMRERNVTVGHANDATTNGTDKIYIAHSVTTEGVVTNKVTVVNYADLSVIETITMPVTVNAINYNFDKDQFITKTAIDVYIWDNTLTYLIDQWQILDEFADVYRSKYPSVARQGTLYYDNMIMCIYSYPNAFVWYDLDTHKMVKMYNPPNIIGIGGIFDEIEHGNYLNGEFYFTAFYRDSDGKTAGNTIGRWNPWKNSQTNFAKYARYIVPINIYVDGDSVIPDGIGSRTKPYKNLTQAIASLKSTLSTFTPINIYCKDGTNVGALRATQCNNINIDIYDESGPGSGSSYTIDGIRVYECNQVFINKAAVIDNAALSNDAAVCEFNRSNITMNSCSITGNAYNVRCNIGTIANFRACAFNGYDTAAILAVSQSSIDYNSECTFSGAAFESYYANVSGPGRYKEVNATYTDINQLVQPLPLISTTITATGTYQLFNNVNISDTAKGKLNYVLFDTGIAGFQHMIPVRIPAAITTPMNFNLTTVRPDGTIGVVEGNFNISTGALVVTNMTNYARIYSVAII